MTEDALDFDLNQLTNTVLETFEEVDLFLINWFEEHQEYGVDGCFIEIGIRECEQSPIGFCLFYEFIDNDGSCIICHREIG